MFTKDQIEAAHSKVKSGADYPAYVQELKALGIISHEVKLIDGEWIFRGVGHRFVTFKNDVHVTSISPLVKPKHFKEILHHHQHGKTDYPTFCKEASECGVERWISDFESMTVTYLGFGNVVIDVEPIPSLKK